MNESQPTADWEHSHALNAGDELRANDDDCGSVEAIHADGSVTVAWESGSETHSETAITTALTHGEIERADGKSHELATY